MTILHPTKIEGRVEAILINADIKDDSIETRRVDEVALSFAGFAGERHSGLVALSDVRYRKQYKKGHTDPQHPAGDDGVDRGSGPDRAKPAGGPDRTGMAWRKSAGFGHSQIH